MQVGGVAETLKSDSQSTLAEENFYKTSGVISYKEGKSLQDTLVEAKIRRRSMGVRAGLLYLHSQNVFGQPKAAHRFPFY